MGDRELIKEMGEMILRGMTPGTLTAFAMIRDLCSSIGSSEGKREQRVRDALVELVRDGKLLRVGSGVFQLRESGMEPPPVPRPITTYVTKAETARPSPPNPPVVTASAEAEEERQFLASRTPEELARLERLNRGDAIPGRLLDLEEPEAEAEKETDDAESQQDAPPPEAQPNVQKVARPRGTFQAWVLAYMRPNVIFRTGDILARAIEHGVTPNQGAGQMILTAMVRRGEIRRVKRGHLALPVNSADATVAEVVAPAPEPAKPVMAVVPEHVPEETPPETEAEPEMESETEAETEPDADAPPPEPEPEEEAPTPKPRRAPKRVAKKKTKKKTKKKRKPARPRAAPAAPPVFSFRETHKELKERHAAAVTRVTELRAERERLLCEIDRMDVELANASADEAEARGLLRVVERLQC